MSLSYDLLERIGDLVGGLRGAKVDEERSVQKQQLAGESVPSSTLVDDRTLDVDCSARLVDSTSEDCVKSAATILKSAGVVVLRSAVPVSSLSRLLRFLQPRVSRILEGLDGHEDLPRLNEPDTFAFAEVCSRGTGRVDVKLKEDDLDNDALAECEETCLAVARLVLGETSVKILSRGVLVSFQGAPAQPWHRDGDQLYGESVVDDLPAYAITLFVPLVDVSSQPAQVLPGSHMARRDDSRFIEPINRPPVEPLLSHGDAELLDYRLMHRGGVHSRPESASVYYAVVARPWFVDNRNFQSTRSLFDDANLRTTVNESRDKIIAADPAIACVGSGRAYSEARLAELAAPLQEICTTDELWQRPRKRNIIFRAKRGAEAVAELERAANFCYVDALCFLRDQDLRNRHLIATPPLPAADALGPTVAADLINRRTATLAVERVKQINGHGAFAVDTISPRTLVAEYAGLVAPSLPTMTDAYALQYGLSLNSEQLAISAKHYGNVARFVNHDQENANADLRKCILQGLVRVVIISKRTINPGEQILVDYGRPYWVGLGRIPLPLSPFPTSRNESPRKPTQSLFSLRSAQSALARLVTATTTRQTSNNVAVDDQQEDTNRDALAAWRDFETW